MNRIGRATLMLCIGVVITRLLWTGGFGWFVRQGMKWPLILATIVLMVFGIYEALSGSKEELRDIEASKRSAGPAIGWMLALPLAVLISVAPTGLGAAAASRVDAFVPTETEERYPALDDSQGPIEMGVFDFVDRALWDSEESLRDVTVRLEGLVVNDPAVPSGFKLTRFLLSCCAADGIPIQVNLQDVGREIADDTWVQVDLEWTEPAQPYGDGNWEVDARALTVVELPEAPTDSYESLSG